MKGASAIFLALALSAQNVLAQSPREGVSTTATPVAGEQFGAESKPRDLEKTVADVSSSNPAPSGAQQVVGSNIGLITYPSFQCQRPQFAVQAPKETQKGTFNPYVGIAGPVTGVNDESYNDQVKKYNATANSYNAQMAAYNLCAQTYTINANADLHRIRDKLELANNASAATAPSGARAVGSNIGLTDYPGAACVRPSDFDESLNPGSVPPLDAKLPEIDAYNLRVTRYKNALSKYSSETTSYNSCIQTYFANANADIQRIQSVLDAAVSSAHNANINIAPANDPKAMQAPAKSFADSYAAPGLQIDKIP